MLAVKGSTHSRQHFKPAALTREAPSNLVQPSRCHLCSSRGLRASQAGPQAKAVSPGWEKRLAKMQHRCGRGCGAGTQQESDSVRVHAEAAAEIQAAGRHAELEDALRQAAALFRSELAAKSSETEALRHEVRSGFHPLPC